MARFVSLLLYGVLAVGLVNIARADSVDGLTAEDRGYAVAARNACTGDMPPCAKPQISQ